MSKRIVLAICLLAGMAAGATEMDSKARVSIETFDVFAKAGLVRLAVPKSGYAKISW